MALSYNGTKYYEADVYGINYKRAILHDADTNKDSVLFWHPKVTWETVTYAQAGKKEVKIYVEPPPPPGSQARGVAKMGNGNNGNIWKSQVFSLSGKETEEKYLMIDITDSTVGLYATVAFDLTLENVNGTDVTIGDADITKAPRAYQIGNNRTGTFDDVYKF